jgi:hypothetical protein
VGDFSVRMRSRGYQPPENHRWEVSLSTGIGITKQYAVTHDQSHYTQGAAIVVPRKVKCHHNLGFPTVLLFDPG